MSQTTDPRPSADDTPQDRTQPFWARRAREGLSQLEGVWKEAQKAQETGLRRAAAAAEDLSKTFAATYADTSERLGKLASEARSRGLGLVDRARELFDLGAKAPAGAESATAEPAEAEPVPVVEPPAPPTERVD